MTTGARAEITVRGKVQKAGYRDHVQEVARSLDIKGFVENMKDGSVKIVCETDEATLKEFVESLRLKTEFVDVKNIEITETQPASGEFEAFQIKYGPLEEEMGERLVAAFNIAVATRQDIKSVDHNLKNMHQDLKTSITSMHTDLKSGIDSMHQDLKSGFESTHQELKDMRVDLKSSVDSMHDDVNRRFEEMANRYDVISAELLKTREELKRAVDTLVELVRKFVEKH